MRTFRGARHSGHLSLGACCVRASHPRQIAWEQAHRPGGARDRSSGEGHGSVMVSMHTGHSRSAASSHQGGVAGAVGSAAVSGCGRRPQ